MTFAWPGCRLSRVFIGYVYSVGSFVYSSSRLPLLFRFNFFLSPPRGPWGPGTSGPTRLDIEKTIRQAESKTAMTNHLAVSTKLVKEPVAMEVEEDPDDIPDDNESVGGDVEISEADMIEIKRDGEDSDYLEAKQKQREKLAEIQQQLAQKQKMQAQGNGRKTSKEQQNEARTNRMNYLMRQSEVFSHFLTGGDGSSASISSLAGSSGSSSGGGGRKKVGRMREDEEDKLLLKQAQSTVKVVRLLKQPSSVEGEMRPYQLEGLNWMIKVSSVFGHVRGTCVSCVCPVCVLCVSCVWHARPNPLPSSLLCFPSYSTTTLTASWQMRWAWAKHYSASPSWAT